MGDRDKKNNEATTIKSLCHERYLKKSVTSVYMEQLYKVRKITNRRRDTQQSKWATKIKQKKKHQELGLTIGQFCSLRVYVKHSTN